MVFFPHSSKLNWWITMQLQEKAMATHSSILAWKSHGQRSMVGCSPWGRTVGHDWSELAELAAKVTADGDCSHEIKRRLLLGRKVMTNLDSIFESRDITLPTKVRLVKAMVFPVVTYGCESWTVKKAERQRIDAFELWYWKDSWESVGLQGDPTSPFWRRSALGVLWKDWC